LDLGTFKPLVNNGEKPMRYHRAQGWKITIFFAMVVGAGDVRLPQRMVAFHIPSMGKIFSLTMKIVTIS
jgi:hypothetical protein